MRKEADKTPVRVGMISLGCAKNLVDAELMLGRLMQDGIEITNDPAQAEVIIVNTCSFIDSAQEESVDTILESSEARDAKNRGQALVVAGCLPQRFREELPKLLPEVDAFMGIDQVTDVTNIIHQALARRNARVGEGHKADATSRRDSGRKVAIGTILNESAPSGSIEDEAADNIRRTRRFGNTKTVVHAPGKEAVSEPILNVNPRPRFIPDYATPRFRLTPAHFAYLKIAEGCNHPCSFCTIPKMRGTHRSRVQADVVAEARSLIQQGVRELNLISQDSTYYGLDLRPNHSRAIASPDRFKAAVKALPGQSTTICTLLRELNALPGDFWIRLLYTHPAHWTDELIATMAECPKVARYVDIPLQHIHENMLERMRRETSREYIVDLLRRIRAGVPGIALRTTFIVGFPGETEAYFDDLLQFIRETRFERLGVFTYSREEGTRAGGMAGQIPEKIRNQRRDRAMALQREMAIDVSRSFVGRTQRVLVEKEATSKELHAAQVSSWEHGLMRGPDQHLAQLKGTYLVARGEADAPDIDGRVYVKGDLKPGTFADVEIVGHTDYDLIAKATRSEGGLSGRS